MPKNSIVQRKLDKKRWFASENVGHDLAGKMPECDYCDYQQAFMTARSNYCGEQHDYRMQECLCAKAYNKKQKAK